MGEILASFQMSCHWNSRSEGNIHYKWIVGILPKYFLARRFLKQSEQVSAGNSGPDYLSIYLFTYFLLPETQTSTPVASWTLYWNISYKAVILSGVWNQNQFRFIKDSNVLTSANYKSIARLPAPSEIMTAIFAGCILSLCKRNNVLTWEERG
jgi:hypothetical protein